MPSKESVASSLGFASASAFEDWCRGYNITSAFDESKEHYLNANPNLSRYSLPSPSSVSSAIGDTGTGTGGHFSEYSPNKATWPGSYHAARFCVKVHDSSVTWPNLSATSSISEWSGHLMEVLEYLCEPHFGVNGY